MRGAGRQSRWLVVASVVTKTQQWCILSTILAERVAPHSRCGFCTGYPSVSVPLCSKSSNQQTHSLILDHRQRAVVGRLTWSLPPPTDQGLPGHMKIFSPLSVRIPIATYDPVCKRVEHVTPRDPSSQPILDCRWLRRHVIVQSPRQSALATPASSTIIRYALSKAQVGQAGALFRDPLPVRACPGGDPRPEPR